VSHRATNAALSVDDTLLAWRHIAGGWPGIRTSVQNAYGAPAGTEPFKVANIHIETNASACDMGPQIKFDTDGITKGLSRRPERP
jgi:hypothetical protein